MKLFLIQFVQKNKKLLSFVTAPTLTVGLGLWSFDLQKLVPSGSIPPKELWEIRMYLSAATIFLFLVALIAIILYAYKNDHDNANTFESPQDNFDFLIFASILRLRSLNQTASAKHISSKTKQETGVILAHLNKLHSSQYVTYQTGGKSPTIDTDFFLTEKAINSIQINTKTNKTRRIRHPGINQ